MNVWIRPLRIEDIKSVTEIERQAFPTMWPPTRFKRELDNRLARYLVAWESESPEDPAGDEQLPRDPARPSNVSWLGWLMSALSRRGPKASPSTVGQRIQGFVGLWFMAGEAHITAIAVEEKSRGKSIGELLLLGSIELAMKKGADVVSLEARVSNHVAQSLYEKYLFEKVGIRKGYYTDNREDAVIMTTQPIHNAAYQEHVHDLREAFIGRHGDVHIQLAMSER